ncbi:hypothetical protein [Bacillus sp. SM2101]|uniref:hypothetical protein n=1 Tax=Bacillus sp. SM2101 TaxID=2805366 RepID=UPI001BDDCE99|nr:hypothetical protein [Bacillus sp. SM2101]
MKISKRDSVVNIGDCCICPIDGCIVQNLTDGSGEDIVEQYLFSTCTVDACLNIKNDSIYCDPTESDPAVTNPIANPIILAQLLGPSSNGNCTPIGPVVQIDPGQMKSLLGKNVCGLQISGMENPECLTTGGCSRGGPGMTCNEVRGNYNGTIRMIPNSPICNCP